MTKTSSPALVERVSFRDTDHSYHLDGKRIPSVTTLLGNLSKPGLVWWSARLAAESIAADLRARIVPAEDEGCGDTVWMPAADIDDLAERARKAHNDRKNQAAAKGSVVHDAIQKFHEDFFNAEAPEDPAARAAWDAFLAWWSTAGLEAVSCERKVVDPDGRYAGRLDLLARELDGGKLHVCDIKTSNGVYPEHVLQNAAYANALEKETGNQVAGTKVLWLPEGATKLVVIERDREEWLLDYAIFDGLISLHGHRRGLDKWLLDVKAEHGPDAS